MIQIGPKYNTDDTLRLSQLFYEAISLTATRSCVQLSTRKRCPCSVINSMRRGAGMSVVRSRARSQRAKISDLGISNVTLLSHPGGDYNFKFSNIGEKCVCGPVRSGSTGRSTGGDSDDDRWPPVCHSWIQERSVCAFTQSRGARLQDRRLALLVDLEALDFPVCHE